MSIPFLRQQQQRALAAGIQLLDASARRRSEETAFGVLRQYDLILGFLERIASLLAGYTELHIFYFPVTSQQLLCVYRTPDSPQPIPVEFQQSLIVMDAPVQRVDQYHYQTQARLYAEEIFKQAMDEILSFEHPPLIKHPTMNRTNGHEDYLHPVIQLLLAVLDGYLPRAYPNGASSLVVCCPVPEQIAIASDRLSSLSGILVLFDDKQSFLQTTHNELAEKIKREFNRYLSEVGQFAVRELEFFLTSLLNQDERVQDNQNRALGFVAHMVAHRFRNFRQSAEYLAGHFPDAEAVSRNPGVYQRQIQTMHQHLQRGERLEKQLSFIGQVPQKVPVTVKQLVEIFTFVFQQASKPAEATIQLIARIPEHLQEETVKAAPPPILEEVFYNHIENIRRVLDRPEVTQKELALRAYVEGKFIYLTLTHYGPPLTPDILEDLQRVVRVRQPGGSGLGMFLSTMVMRHVGGDQSVESPVPGLDRGVRVILKFALQ